MTTTIGDLRPATRQRVANAATVLPSTEEVVCAVWGTSVEAAGGPAAGQILVHLHDLAELYAAQLYVEQYRLDNPDAAEFACSRDFFTGCLDAVLASELPDLVEADRAAMVTLFEELAAMAARTHRACRQHLGTTDPAVHEHWTRLAQLRDRYSDWVTTLVKIPPWLADVFEGPR